MSKVEYFKALYKTGAGLLSADKIWTRIKDLDDVKALNIKKKDLVDFAKNLDVNQINKKVVKQKVFRQITAPYPKYEYQMDLMDFTKYSKQNKGYGWLLNIIDIYSRFAWSLPVKDKTAKSVFDALKPILDEYKPEIITTDNGGEFDPNDNNDLSEYCMARGIDRHLNEPGDHNHLGIIERFNGTLRRMLVKLFAINGNFQWYSQIKEAIDTYNESAHSTTKNSPLCIFQGKCPNEQKVLKEDTFKGQELKLHDKVRVKYEKKVFDKSGQTCSRDVFNITAKNGNKYTLDIPDDHQLLKQRAYKPEELMKVANVVILEEPVLDQKSFEPKQMDKVLAAARKQKRELDRLI